MELTCPNCAARYRVSADAIPPEGRTVRCPNCDASWFQDGAIASADAAELPPNPADLIGHSGAVEPAGGMGAAHEIDGPAVEAELAVRAELEREGAPQPPPFTAPPVAASRVYADDDTPARRSGGLGALTWVLLAIVLALGAVIAWGVSTGRIAI